jgi:hypothetical protein
MPGGGARAGSSGREWRTTRRRHDVGWVSSSREQQQGMEDLLSSFGGKGATAGARARAVEQKSQTLGAMRALRSFILPWPKQRSRAHQIARSAPPAKSPGLRTCALRPPPRRLPRLSTPSCRFLPPRLVPASGPPTGVSKARARRFALSCAKASVEYRFFHGFRNPKYNNIKTHCKLYYIEDLL